MAESTPTIEMSESPEPKQLSSWRLRSPGMQNFIGAAVQGLCPGIYVSIISLGAGAGRPESARFSNFANLIVYAFFSVSCVACGPLVNMWGPRICLALGATGYAAYVSGLWYFSEVGRLEFPYIMSAYLGITAGFLWVSSSFMSQAYATERYKARYITVQYVTFTGGQLIGSFVAFGANVNRSSAGGVGAAVYIVYIILHLGAAVLSLFCVVDPRTVVRNDGTHIAIFKSPSVMEELKGMKEGFTNPRIFYFIPAAITMDFWQAVSGGWNSQTFTLRARGLNSIGMASMKIISILVFNAVLSTKLVSSRRKRLGICMVYAIFFNLAAWLGWIGWLAAQGPDYKRKTTPPLDWSMGAVWAKAFVVFQLLGFMAPLMRNYVYYLVAIASNHPQHQARYAAIIHAAPQWGQVIAFGVDASEAPFIQVTAIYTSIIMVVLGLASYGVFKHTTETLWGTEEGVIVPLEEANKLALARGDVEQYDTDSKKEDATVQVLAAK